MAFTSRPLSRNDRGAPTNYRRKYTISVHAIERYRERVDVEDRHRDDQDLGNMLDERMQHPESKQTIRDPRAPEEITQLFEIVTRTGQSYFVLVRNDTAVTVLDPSMVQNNFAEGTWKQALNTPFTNDALKKTMRDIQANGTKKLTSTDQAILRGDLPPPKTTEVALPAQGSAPVHSPLELAGIAHARALKRCRETEIALERAKRDVERLETELAAAQADRDAAQAHLTELVLGDVS